MATKRYLFTPGPTPVPPEVLAAVGAPVIHHRSPEFLPVYERVLTRLREVCRTENDVLLFGASGTGAFESAVANLVSPGEPHLVISAGSFGDRWVAMTTAFGEDVDVLRYAWGETPDADDLRARLAEQEAKAVWFVQSETSTGVVAGVRALAAVAKEAGAIVVVDAVSSLGAVPCETDAWGLDVVVSGSQKGMMTPPAPALAAISERARAGGGFRAGAGRDRLLASLLLRLGADAEGARDARRAVHAARLARRRPRRRARAPARGGAGGGVRSQRAARQGGARRREGARPRALLPGRGPERRSDRRPRTGWHRWDRRGERPPGPLRDHDRERPGRAEGEDLPPRAHRL